MKKNLSLILAGAGTAVLGLVSAFAASAQVVVPTSTTQSLLANVGSQISDPGTLAVIILAVGIPLAFYVIHQLMGLVPKSRGRRQ